jgi:agmatinase
MDEGKLKHLRERYGAALGGEMFDPQFKAVAEQQFASGDRRKWPFADVATLLGARYRPEAPDLPDFGGLDFALIGIPMDLGVTNRSGSRFGPRAVRAVERVGPYEHVLKRAPLAMAKFADVGDLPMR